MAKVVQCWFIINVGSLIHWNSATRQKGCNLAVVALRFFLICSSVAQKVDLHHSSLLVQLTKSAMQLEIVYALHL